MHRDLLERFCLMHGLHLDICSRGEDNCFSVAVVCSSDTMCACFDYDGNVNVLQKSNASSIEEACKWIVKMILEHDRMYWFEDPSRFEVAKVIDISMFNTIEELAVHLDLRMQEA